MDVSRREFLNLLGCLAGGWALAMPKPYYLGEMARSLVKISNPKEPGDLIGAKEAGVPDSGADRHKPDPALTAGSTDDLDHRERGINLIPEDERVLEEIGYFNDISPEAFLFDENKYSDPKRQLEPSEWGSTNRHLPIKIDPNVINRPGERSPQAVQRVVEYTPFNNPRYVAAAGERVSMCNIAAWDWSRALQVHLPHWIGDTEMSANMLFRWISHSQAGGIYGEGWQPVEAGAAQILAQRGIPVFALAENPTPGRHGHVALVYPQNPDSRTIDDKDGLYFATFTNGRSRGGNGIKNLRDTFRRLTPTYFVHNSDFIVYRDS